MIYVIKYTDPNKAKKALIANGDDIAKLEAQALKEGKTLDSVEKIKDDLKEIK